MAKYHVELKTGASMEDIDADGVRQSETGDYEFFKESVSGSGGKRIVAAVPKESVKYIVEKTS